MIYSASRTSKHIAHLHSIFVSTHSVLFLGTPHHGSDVAKLAGIAHRTAATMMPKKILDTNDQLLNALRIIGTPEGKGGVISFEMKGAHAHDVATVIDRQGVAVRAGTHCAMPLLTRFGATSTCRASFGLYNTHAEVDALADALTRAQAMFA